MNGMYNILSKNINHFQNIILRDFFKTFKKTISGRGHLTHEKEAHGPKFGGVAVTGSRWRRGAPTWRTCEGTPLRGDRDGEGGGSTVTCMICIRNKKILDEIKYCETDEVGMEESCDGLSRAIMLRLWQRSNPHHHAPPVYDRIFILIFKMNQSSSLHEGSEFVFCWNHATTDWQTFKNDLKLKISRLKIQSII